MSAEIGSWVQWTEATPTRLGYKTSDLGKVIGVRRGRSGHREIDVEFGDGDVLRGAFEGWFERAKVQTGIETPGRPCLLDREPC